MEKPSYIGSFINAAKEVFNAPGNFCDGLRQGYRAGEKTAHLLHAARSGGNVLTRKNPILQIAQMDHLASDQFEALTRSPVTRAGYRVGHFLGCPVVTGPK